MTKTLLSILTAAVVTYLVRVLPLTLIRKPIRSRFLRSFLYYVPYVTLAVMTFPAIVQATEQPIAGAAALVAGILIAWRGGGLITAAWRSSRSFCSDFFEFSGKSCRFFTGIRYDHSTMLYREKAAARRLFLCRNADRPAGFSAEGIIRLHLFSPTPLASGSFA